jgi:hypothetical protein
MSKDLAHYSRAEPNDECCIKITQYGFDRALNNLR